MIPLSIAPMMQRTDRHYRAFMRLLTKHTLLYTEMVTANALVHGDPPRWLDYNDQEHPLVLQVGGDDPARMAHAARLAEQWGYDQVNLNIGCPSDRVQSGNFGVCLMGQPERVADCVRAMQDACDLPVTVKHRIGFDDLDRYDDMLAFVDTVAQAGCTRFTAHARKAWLQGLSPKENRNVPPLRYDDVYRLKRERPHLEIEINGGVTTWDQVHAHLEHVDAVMIGRAAYDNPLLFAQADARLFDDPHPTPSRTEIVHAMVAYADHALARWPGTRIGHIAKHLLTLFNGQPGARAWRHALSTGAFRSDARPTAMLDALAAQERAAQELAASR